MQVKPDRKNRTGALYPESETDCGGRYKLNAISHFVDVALWESFSSFPPKEEIVALVVTAMLSRDQSYQLSILPLVLRVVESAVCI